MSRQLGKENWNIDKFLQIINREITARKKLRIISKRENKKRFFEFFIT